MLHALPAFTPRCVSVALNSSKPFSKSWGVHMLGSAANIGNKSRTQLVAASCSSRDGQEHPASFQQAAVDIQAKMGPHPTVTQQQQSSLDSMAPQSGAQGQTHQRNQKQHHGHSQIPVPLAELERQQQLTQHPTTSTDELVPTAIAKISRFLQFRERCASETLQKLQTLGYSKLQSEQVLGALQQAGLQSDARFADMYVRGYWRTKAYSPSRLAYELSSRGVEQQYINTALSGVFGDRQQLPREALSPQEEDTWNHLVEACRQQVDLSAGQPQAKRKWVQHPGYVTHKPYMLFDGAAAYRTLLARDNIVALRD